MEWRPLLAWGIALGVLAGCHRASGGGDTGPVRPKPAATGSWIVEQCRPTTPPPTTPLPPFPFRLDCNDVVRVEPDASGSFVFTDRLVANTSVRVPLTQTLLALQQVALSSYLNSIAGDRARLLLEGDFEGTPFRYDLDLVQDAAGLLRGVATLTWTAGGGDQTEVLELALDYVSP